MRKDDLTDDAKAILLLCARLGDGSDASPLTLSEYNKLAEWLVDQELKPGDLLGNRGVNAIESGFSPIPPARMKVLLGRGAALGFDVERWINQGIWIVCRSDEDYPRRLRTHLKQKAPAFFYCSGNHELLDGGGLAIVGSRNVDAEGERFTQRVAARCAEMGMKVISGGARGVDQTAMLTALERQGQSIGVLADSLSKEMLSPRYRPHLMGGRLLLMSPYYPTAKFSVGNAMGRNKHVYGLADHTFVVSCEEGEGGTWAGAREELSNKVHRPVLVRVGEGVPTGNVALMKLGAIPFPEDFFHRLPEEALADASTPVVAVPEVTPQIEDHRAIASEQPLKEEVQTTSKPKARKAKTTKPRSTPPKVKPATVSEANPPDGTFQKGMGVLEAVAPLILAALEKERTAESLAELLNVRAVQTKDWLDELCSKNLVKKLTKPVRYLRSSQTGLDL